VAVVDVAELVCEEDERCEPREPDCDHSTTISASVGEMIGILSLLFDASSVPVPPSLAIGDDADPRSR